MLLKSFLYLSCLLSFGSVGSAQQPSELVREKLEQRYKGQRVNVVPPNVYVGIAEIKGPSFFVSDGDFTVHYDHFLDGVEIPKRYQGRDRFDERTTQEVEATAVLYVSKMDAGEALEVVKVAFLKRGGLYMFDILLKAISARHLSVRARQAQGATILAKNDVGVHFRFYLPPEIVEKGNDSAVARQIDRYLLPAAEYETARKRAEVSATEPKRVELGQTEEQVVTVLGKPETVINLGTRTTYVYRNMKVIFVDGKVVDVQ